MSMTINATTRDDQGKGASRRLRREEQVPARAKILAQLR